MIPYGSLVVYVTPKGRRYVRRLEQGQDWHSNDGGLSAEQVEGLNFGAVAYTSLGIPILVQEATLHDRLLHVKRQTQIIYPKDIAYICLRLAAGPGQTILEAGCGSGALTLGFSWFCGPTGRVISHEARAEFLRLARRNLEWAGLGDNVELHHRDISEGFVCNGVGDALFLDVRTPWEYLQQSVAALRPGATLGFLLPTVDQVSKLLFSLEQGSFSDIDVCEILVRRWKPVPDRLRPEDRMIAHTGFLIFCRLQEGAPLQTRHGSLGTRERKQEAARAVRQERALLPDS